MGLSMVLRFWFYSQPCYWATCTTRDNSHHLCKSFRWKAIFRHCVLPHCKCLMLRPTPFLPLLTRKIIKNLKENKDLRWPQVSCFPSCLFAANIHYKPMCSKANSNPPVSSGIAWSGAIQMQGREHQPSAQETKLPLTSAAKPRLVVSKTEFLKKSLY